MTRLSWAWAWALAMAMVGTAWGQTVYWIDQEGNGVHRATVGGEQMLFAERLHGAGEVAVDGADGVIIWRQPEGMRQGTLELDTIEEFDVGIDGGGGKFVLSRETDEYFFVSGWTIYRGELGSTGVTEVISYEDGEQGAYTRLIAALAVDELNRKLYYVYYYYIRTGIIDGGIFRINFDGSGAEQLIEDPGVGITEQLAIDPEGGWIFWDSVREIKRARLDGSDVSIVVSGQRDGVLALAVNPVTDQLLWIANTLPGQFRLFASELDGSMARLFGGEILEPGGLAVDEVTGRIYWGELNGIGRLEADGSGRVQLGPGFAQPYRLQLDAEARTLTVAMEGKVQASGLEAWSATDLNLNEDIGTVLGIDVNAETGAAVWAEVDDLMESVTGRILLFRNNPGLGSSTLLEDLGAPHSTHYDRTRGGVYWAEIAGAGTQTDHNRLAVPVHVRHRGLLGFVRTVVAGLEMEVVVTGLGPESIEVAFADLVDLALDEAGDFLYYAAGSTIGRLEVSSGQTETVVEIESPGAGELRSRYAGGLALDPVRGELYWGEGAIPTDPSARVPPSGVIRRVALDGSGVRDVLELEVAPIDIALDPFTSRNAVRGWRRFH